MTDETNYGITEATPSLPARDLLRVPHQGKTLVVAYPAFGPNTHKDNLAEMGKKYSHSSELPEVSFEEPTTAESISVVAYDVARTKKEILDQTWLQTGRVVRTSEGVFANPPKDVQGNPIIDERKLKSLLDGAEKVGGIYLCKNDFGFAPYETFERGVQEACKFAEGGLARALEHTSGKKAENLLAIASPKFYELGFNVWEFDKVTEPVLRIATLYSTGSVLRLGLDVYGYYWYGDIGCAFGVCRDVEIAEGDSPKK